MKQSVSKETEKELYTSRLQKVQQKQRKLFKHAVMREFLKIGRNATLLERFMQDPNQKHMEQLEASFRDFYYEVRITNYLNGMSRRMAIDYDKKLKKHKERFQLIIDQPTDAALSLADVLAADIETPLDTVMAKEQQYFFENVQNPKLQRAFTSIKLQEKQKQLLELRFNQQLTNKEIARRFGQTEQNISYWLKKTLTQIKKAYQNLDHS
ncbi:sigma-70 family RNA polymerase sigma factor [Ectobacillus antri]|uniref:Sigma-70 family RNA polymerase sigma factor n=1 Tax=Ectobacillus antri TaxID=2486280 RepID=A0ABT6H859_9BACI|nr:MULTISPECIES: sigma-70 family RNA polymerase sigma factor [Ectobacillus]MDG4657782.1 sigma-70 family RNA polymerase sigma factor [Ectobacillus antri]MDG5754827.1 sigma-70 family RNA polymerase sigma factor [Ectobacillus antri]UOY92286.1 sigma-70 family RNA polymerase sigma factor [Ectobacillus sp. JY-23]